MAGIYYATPGTGKLAYAIGWIDLGTIALTPPVDTIPLTYTLPRGFSISFDISTSGQGLNTRTDVIPTWSGSAMGIKGYLNIGGKPAIHGNGTGQTDIHMANFVFRDRFNNKISDYALYIADAEATWTAAEGIGFKSDKTINQVDVYPPNFPCPTMVGDGTNTITIGWTNAPCSGNSYNSRIFQTTSPNNIVASLFTRGGGEAMALGISLQQLKVSKEVKGRLYSKDQFELMVIGNRTMTTITTGTSDGLQSEVVEYFGAINEGLFVTEKMGAGSTGNLTGYETLVTIANIAGGSIPNGQILNDTIPLFAGDFLEVKITNIPIVPHIKPIKSVDKTFAFQGEKIGYTIILPNTSPNEAINTIFRDTLPVGATFVDGSIKINGVATSENIPNINVGTIKGNTVTTITFDVIAAVTIPIVNRILNSGIIDYSYPLVNSTPNLKYPSNEVFTDIGARPTVTGTKEVDLKNAKLNTILTYTLVYTNTGVIDVTNLTFLDDPPKGTTFVDGSLFINGVNDNRSPISPGIQINPTILKVNETITITFKAKVTSIFEISPYKNKGTLLYNYSGGEQTFSGSTDTNVVETNVKYLDVFITKYVDKEYADYGDAITYSIKIETVGNIVSENMIFKDTIPVGTNLIGNSVYFNGNNLAGANIQNGVNLGNLNPNTINTVNFSVIILKKN
ncbi:MAG: DUF11 domain-containing protein [Clostridium sp.]